jgi:Kef-type K+ transport system membrane component KefB
MKLTTFYAGTIVFMAGATATILGLGGSGADVVSRLPAEHTELLSSIVDRLHQPLGRLLLQLVVVLSVARIVGATFRRLGFPSVVGEMTAGIMLGPSLLGLLAPDVFANLFPKDSLGTLSLFSRIGIIFFMFGVGMELDVSHLRSRVQSVIAVSHASIALPFLLGMILALFAYRSYAGPSANFASFALFMGIAMSITAFPVLARILQERNLTKTPLGNIAIACAAVDDVTAWSIMAFVVAVAGASGVTDALLTLGLAAAFAAVMIMLVRPALESFVVRQTLESDENLNCVLVVAAGIVVAAALATELIGIHALFGAFMAGAVMPRIDGFPERISLRLERFARVMLLPLFFVFTGLRTRIDLLAGAGDCWFCALVITAATLGKLGGGALAARLSGLGMRQSLQIGALMNTRGLMELIALNIGYDMGILSPRIFTILVLMALATTLMTGPLLTLFSERDDDGEQKAGLFPARS